MILFYTECCINHCRFVGMLRFPGTMAPVVRSQNTLFFYKNVVFPAQAEYSYFSADFRLKIFLYYS